MAHFAEIDENGIVKRVIVVSNDCVLDEAGAESEAIGIKFCQDHFGGSWIKTSYNCNIRRNYAAVGGTYRADLDAFIMPRPYPSWTLDEQSCSWSPPIPDPSQPGGPYFYWDESTGSWIRLAD